MILIRVSCAAVFVFGTASAFQTDSSSVRRTSEGIVIEMSTLVQDVSCSFTSPAPVEMRSVQRKADRRILIRPSLDPLFEFSVNGSIVSSRQPIWTAVSSIEDALVNGGHVARLVLQTLDSLQVTLEFQWFPGTELIRQRLLISAPQGKFRLSMLNNAVHVIFPSFRVAGDLSANAEVRDIHLARWVGEERDVDMKDLANEDHPDEPVARLGRNLRQNYMYSPVERIRTISPTAVNRTTGSIQIVHDRKRGTEILLTREHDSPLNDSMCVWEYTPGPSGMDVRQRIQAGAYCSGDPLPGDAPFETPWISVGWAEKKTKTTAQGVLRDLVRRWITDHPPSRYPHIYYNTWGMQREENAKGKDVRSVLTNDRAISEARFASELGAELYVLDDGWQKHFGDWTPHPEKFPSGLRPLAEELVQRNMTFGIWMGLLAVDSASTVCGAHPEWLVRDVSGVPVRGRWDRQTMCLVSGFRDHVLSVCRRLIDEGVRFFKWDGLDYHPCASPDHLHGTAVHSDQERIERHRYEFIRVVTALAHEVHRYNQDVVVEFDVTEPGRSVGLTFLQEGKFFWMNNGASHYGDLSTYRAKSTRNIPMQYAPWFPVGLQTYAAYPHQHSIYNAQRYNVNSSLIWGRGFWGDLSAMKEAQRKAVGEMAARIRRVTRAVTGQELEVSGNVGSSPEIYALIDRRAAEGFVAAFSGSALTFPYSIAGVNVDSLLAVVGNPFEIRGNTVRLNFEFTMPEVSREALLYSNGGNNIRLLASTAWIKDARLEPGPVFRLTAVKGRHIVHWGRTNGRPEVVPTDGVKAHVGQTEGGGDYEIVLETQKGSTDLMIRSARNAR